MSVARSSNTSGCQSARVAGANNTRFAPLPRRPSTVSVSRSPTTGFDGASKTESILFGSAAIVSLTLGIVNVVVVPAIGVPPSFGSPFQSSMS